MGSRRRSSDLKKRLNLESDFGNSTNKQNRNSDQELTGVTLPAPGKLKGWEFGQGVSMACANVNSQFFAVQGDCPRCGFDLFKGDLLLADNEDTAACFDDLPRVACPTCATTYGLLSGKAGPPFRRTGLAGFVANLAKSATTDNSMKGAKVYTITRKEDGRLYCRERVWPS
jgi:hypothetical protein